MFVHQPSDDTFHWIDQPTFEENPMTTTRYALVDRHSGYIWHVCDAETPEDAALQTQIAVDGDRGYTVEHLFLGDTTDRGYEVHVMPADWECDDGQDPEKIEELFSYGTHVDNVWVHESAD